MVRSLRRLYACCGNVKSRAYTHNFNTDQEHCTHVTMEWYTSVAEDVCLSVIDFGALPEAVVLMLFSQLPLKDMLQAGSSCHHWNRCEAAIPPTRQL